MKLKNSRLLALRQLDQKLEKLKPLSAITRPDVGWIYSFRRTLNISLQQLGSKLNMSPQAVKDLEKREADYTISLKALEEAGQALGLKLVYGFIPYHGSLEEMIEQKAREVAQKIIKRTATTMALEDQANSESRLQQAFEEMVQELKKEMPKTLWH